VHSCFKLLGSFLLATTLGQQALAQGATVSSPVELAHRSAHLKSGQWVWAPQISPQGPLLVYVNLSTQRATVYRNGVRIGVSTVSSGKPGYETPTLSSRSWRKTPITGRTSRTMHRCRFSNA
jgi:hypothetical protein